jgi:hypothetical protein
MKRRTKPKSDPYRVMMGAAHDLEMEGIDAHTITDALFVAAVHGALVIVGREAVAESLREMAVMVEGKNSFRPMIAGRAADDCRSLQIARVGTFGWHVPDSHLPQVRLKQPH